MYIIPAIDILGGKCVRLVQGEYNRYINYEDDPAKKAVEFKNAGAEWLHIIDLDGAKVGRCVNIDAIRDIASNVQGLKIQVGGGIRERQSVVTLLELGITRVILGTKAVHDFDWFSAVVKEHPGRIVLSLDARGTKVATDGWKTETAVELMDVAQRAAALPLEAIIFTDINKDGMLSGPNIERTRHLAETVKLPIIAAGGVTTIEDIQKLAETKVIAAAIIGRALYEDTVNLSEAIELCRKLG